MAINGKDDPMTRFSTAAVAALIAVSAAAVPMTAAAQSRHNDNDGRHAAAQRHQTPAWQSINARQTNLERRITQSLRNGAISRREATSLRAEFRQIANLESRYRRGGLSAWERRDLDQRFDRLSTRIRMERRDDDGRADRDGRGGRDGRRT